LELPVHRFDDNSSRSKVFAYKSEIDQWLKNKANNNKKTTKSNRKNKWIMSGLIFGLVTISGLLLSYYLAKTKALPTLSRTTIAVFPLKNLNSSDYENYFSQGLTNEIIGNIAKPGKLIVVPVNSDLKCNNKSKNSGIKGLDYVLKGSLERDEDRIRISLSLIRAKDNKNLWTKVYEEQAENIFFIPEKICNELHETLNINPSSFYSSRQGKTHDYQALDNYLKGNFILNIIVNGNEDPWKLYHKGKYYVNKYTKEANDLAVTLFNKAIETDSNYALAYIGLAQCYSNYINFEWDFNIRWLNKAENLLEKAHKISPDIPEYYSTLIEICLLKYECFYQDNRNVVLELSKEGIEKYPNDPQLNSIVGHYYLSKFGEEGDEADFEKAFKFKEKSFLLNPYGINNLKYAELLMLRGEFNKAIEVCKLIEKANSSIFSKFRLGEIYYYQGNPDKSEAIFLQFDNPLNFKIHSLFYLAMIAAQKGEIEKVQKIIKEIEILKPPGYGDFKDRLLLASIYAGMGNEELGYRYLISYFNDENARKERYIDLKCIEFDKNFDNIRNNKIFRKIKGKNLWLKAKSSE
jgi:TolB-like protein